MRPFVSVLHTEIINALARIPFLFLSRGAPNAKTRGSHRWTIRKLKVSPRSKLSQCHLPSTSKLDVATFLPCSSRCGPEFLSVRSLCATPATAIVTHSPVTQDLNSASPRNFVALCGTKSLVYCSQSSWTWTWTSMAQRYEYSTCICSTFSPASCGIAYLPAHPSSLSHAMP